MKKYIVALVACVSIIPSVHAETWNQKGFCSAGSMVGNNLVICDEATIHTEHGFIKHALVNSVPSINMNMDETGKLHSVAIGGHYETISDGGCSYSNVELVCHAKTNENKELNVIFNLD